MASVNKASGVGFKTSTTSSSAGSVAALASRDVVGSGGYSYRQYEDGTIVILTSPYGTSNKTVQTGTSEWAAISKEIGPFPNQINPQTGKKWTAAEWALVLSTGAQAAAAVVQAGAKKTRKKKGMPEVLPPAPVPPPSEMPSWLIPAGIGGLALILILAMRGSGGSQPQAAA